MLTFSFWFRRYLFGSELKVLALKLSILKPFLQINCARGQEYWEVHKKRKIVLYYLSKSYLLSKRERRQLQDDFVFFLIQIQRTTSSCVTKDRILVWEIFSVVRMLLPRKESRFSMRLKDRRLRNTSHAKADVTAKKGKRTWPVTVTTHAKCLVTVAWIFTRGNCKLGVPK